MTDLSKILGAEWKALGAEERKVRVCVCVCARVPTHTPFCPQPFDEQAKADKERYGREKAMAAAAAVDE